MRIDVISDTVCPWCYVGKRKMERALALRPEIDFDIHWHPFQLAPDVPDAGVDRQSYYREKFGDGGRIEAMTKRLAEVGKSLGIQFAFDDIAVQPNTRRSHALIALAEGPQQDAVKEAILSAFFEQGLDIGDRDVLVRIGEASGLDGRAVRAALDDAEGLAAVTQHAQAAREMGVSGVPTFIFEQQQAFSGAQDEALFLQVIDELAESSNRGRDAAPTGASNAPA